MIRSAWMSDAGYASGVRAEKALSARAGLDQRTLEHVDLPKQMSLASLGATLVAVVVGIVMGMGKVAQSSPWSAIAEPPDYLLFAWGMPGLFYSGLATILALAACTLAVLLIVAFLVFIFHRLVCVGSLASALMAGWREARRSKRLDVARMP